MMALNGLCYAGGDIAPVEPEVTVPEVAAASGSGFYVGLGVSAMSLRDDDSDEEFSATGLALQAGYQFNQYFALEGRYTFNVSDVEYDHGTTSNPDYDDYPTDFSNAGIYLKPMYPIDNFKLYALLGYGEVKLTDVPVAGVDSAENGFQWGLGASYSFNENISAFVDYVRAYDDTGFGCCAREANVIADLWTLGVSYKF